MNKLIVDYTLKGQLAIPVKLFRDMCFYNIPLQHIQSYLNGLYPMFSVYIEHVEEQVDGVVLYDDITFTPPEDIPYDVPKMAYISAMNKCMNSNLSLLDRDHYRTGFYNGFLTAYMTSKPIVITANYMEPEASDIINH